jgi:hypothetical protein
MAIGKYTTENIINDRSKSKKSTTLLDNSFTFVFAMNVIANLIKYFRDSLKHYQLMRQSIMEKDISAGQILEREFEYVATTAHQANDDRHKLLSFYVGLATTAGTIAIGILSFSQNNYIRGLVPALSLLSFLLAVIGWIFLAMMIRLRQAWFESLLAMNKIKSFYIQKTNRELETAFLWDQDTLPRPERFWNIHFYATTLINFISSLALLISAVIQLAGSMNLIVAGFVGVLILITSMLTLTFIYWLALVRNI